MDEILAITQTVVATLEGLGVPYLVGGSLASSLHGIPRATQDVDIVAALAPEHVPGLVAAFRADFHFDADTVRDAIERQESFNLIHLGTLLKVDVFVAKDDAAASDQMRRRQRFVIEDDPRCELVVASPEDVVAHKLCLGEGVSERQWRDAMGVLHVAGRSLDLDYLRAAAERYGVEDLLERALGEAEIQAPEDS